MYAVFKREFLSYFRNPVGYIAIAVFSFLSGFVFSSQFSQGYINISGEIISLRNFFIVIVPIITMGLFADDKKRGTEVIYYTSPITISKVVMGKFLAALSLFAVMFINVIIHMIVTVLVKGKIDAGTIGSIIVFFFLASMFIAIGMLASAITDSQVIAAIVTFIAVLTVQLIPTIATYASGMVYSLLSLIPGSNIWISDVSANIENGIKWLDPFTKILSFRSGVFAIAPLFYLMSVGAIFLFLTYRVIEKKRWSQS